MRIHGNSLKPVLRAGSKRGKICHGFQARENTHRIPSAGKTHTQTREEAEILS